MFQKAINQPKEEWFGEFLEKIRFRKLQKQQITACFYKKGIIAKLSLFTTFCGLLYINIT